MKLEKMKNGGSNEKLNDEQSVLASLDILVAQNQTEIEVLRKQIDGMKSEQSVLEGKQKEMNNLVEGLEKKFKAEHREKQVK